MPAQQVDPRSKDAFRQLYASKKAREVPTQVKEILRAQPSMETLTRSSEWDFFLSCCQFLLETAERSKMSVDRQLCDEPVFDHDSLIKLKAQSLCMGERIFTITQLMGLPKQIMEDGEKVLQHLMAQEH